MIIKILLFVMAICIIALVLSFAKEDEIREEMRQDSEEYSIIVRWYHDEPMYTTASMRGVEYWKSNPEVRAVEIVG